MRASPPIRRIAVYVDETKDGMYRWILIEQVEKPRRWMEIESSSSASESYRDAMAAGLLVLQRMIDNLDQGPRQSDGRLGAPGKTEAARPLSTVTNSSETARRNSGSHFGFGDLPG
ncbi:hypothetical protein QTH90_29055 [Variovorax sp. J2P1-59]|uniref:hypothetical protein n=1 Tax=Variovorax flavidus TaxID=3053501 RepID=UPI002577035F|nr:hypothetical protein [Variovorax sp. J2P1-59]MDM0078488.1 hypothetical protein [Variovorax sp. J2P1-59]